MQNYYFEGVAEQKSASLPEMKTDLKSSKLALSTKK